MCRSKTSNLHSLFVVVTDRCTGGPGPEIIQLFSFSAQLRLKFILFINVKMLTTVGILTFISRINTGFGDLNLKFQFIWVILSFMSSLNFMLS